MGLEFAFNAFCELTGERQMGMGLGPIPLTAIWAYADRHGLAEDETEELVYLIREADKEFLAYHREQAKRDSQPPPSPPNGSRRQL